MQLKENKVHNLDKDDEFLLLEKIAEKANEIYHERQRTHTAGNDVTDWLKAEKIIIKEFRR